ERNPTNFANHTKALDQYLQLALSLKLARLSASKTKRSSPNMLDCIGESINQDVLQPMIYLYHVMVISISDTTLPVPRTQLEGRYLNIVIITLKSSKRYRSSNVKETSS